MSHWQSRVSESRCSLLRRLVCQVSGDHNQPGTQTPELKQPMREPGHEWPCSQAHLSTGLTERQELKHDGWRQNPVFSILIKI